MVKLTPELVQAIHDYLIRRPMSEVEQLVLELRTQASPRNGEGETNEDF